MCEATESRPAVSHSSPLFSSRLDERRWTPFRIADVTTRWLQAADEIFSSGRRHVQNVPGANCTSAHHTDMRVALIWREADFAGPIGAVPGYVEC